ncbi:MAG: acyltransferase, partial [Rickettsiales bacterium]|nr:acyltransferase [Rickettsiales bacterium]
NRIEIGSRGIFKNLTIDMHLGNEMFCKIGQGVKINGSLFIGFKDEKTSCIIGNGCLFGTGVEIRTTDYHPIYDRDTGKRINVQKYPTTIGNHCWFAEGALVLKNAQIPNNTIVGTRAIVTKSFDAEFTTIAGAPARVIKENVTWENK